MTTTRPFSRFAALFFALLCTMPLALQAAALNDPAQIRKELDEIRQDDRRLRDELIAAREKARAAGGEFDDSQARLYSERIAVLDFGNQARLDSVVARIGWPSITTYGRDAALGAFLVVQHGDLEFQQKYLPLLRTAAAKGESEKSWLAALEDLVLTRQNKPQRYGTQVDTQNGVTLKPTEDEARLDARRAELGLEPICTYLARFEARAGKITYAKCVAAK